MGSSWTNSKLQRARTQRIRTLRVRAFRAVDDVNMSKRFSEAHHEILQNHGITKLSSLSTDWMDDPDVYVIVITSPSGHKIYAGARVHVYREGRPLPLQLVMREFDPRTDEIFEKFAEEGVGEFCALWSSVEIAGLGINGKDLVKCGWSMCDHLGIRRMVALLSPLTKRWMKDLALVKCEALGTEGEIPYPDHRFISTVTTYKHPEGREELKDEFLAEVIDLQNNPQQKKQTSGIKGTVSVHFDLLK